MSGEYGAEPLLEVLVLVEARGGAEVDDLEVGARVVSLVEDVFGFEIAVHDFVLVAVVYGAEQQLHGFLRVLLAEVVRRDDAVEQLAPFAELGDDEDAGLVLEELDHADDVRMVLWKQRLPAASK